ncbi:MAG: hypothetical protein PHI85_07720 [Victivallaceae bacterium]|nr:hypothetical protein [Victivallaceae bacterium]
MITNRTNSHEKNLPISFFRHGGSRLLRQQPPAGPGAAVGRPGVALLPTEGVKGKTGRQTAQSGRGKNIYSGHADNTLKRFSLKKYNADLLLLADNAKLRKVG